MSDAGRRLVGNTLMGRPKLNVKQVGVQLTPLGLARLDRLFGNRRNQRSKFIREAIDAALDVAEAKAGLDPIVAAED